MAKRNRSTLKNYFRKGALPAADHFSDLIDSCLNTLEEGFDKSINEGFKVSSLEDNANLMSFYRDSTPNTILWSIHFDKDIDAMLFSAPNVQYSQTSPLIKPESASVLSLTPTACVGINCDKPSETLEVNGTVKSIGRLGGAFEKELGLTSVKADGQWHNISPKLEGCHAFEVMAGVGIKSSGRYALIRSIAMNTCDPDRYWFDIFNWFSHKKTIKSQHAYYLSTGDKLLLRWVKADNYQTKDEAYRPYYLQIRTRTDYGEGVFIRYHITQMWFDQYMTQSEALMDKDSDAN
ncbi:hypothetical protein HQQ94_18385 [Shewanella sp. VB17]|uniref:hypothetical protein n=1 Tax=Shewanella sp. VB17 TaxID=2739432 RepID=UPI0015659C8F|nr:hypothetical protein [Shewanella sp. VB17]NRD75151.1 hypothetical protein [Shewanella sp. VB17]